MGKYLFYGLLVAFTLEMLDMIHRAYEAEESIDVIHTLMGGRMFNSIVVVQILIGSAVPIIALGVMQVVKMTPRWRRILSWEMGLLVLVGVFTMRWNVVIGGQLFSKSLRGFTIYKMEFFGKEGAVMALFITALPLVIFAILVKLLPPWVDRKTEESLAVDADADVHYRRKVPFVLALLPVLGLLVGLFHSPTEGSEIFTRPTPEPPPSTAPGIFQPGVRQSVPDTETDGEPADDMSSIEPSMPPAQVDEYSPEVPEGSGSAGEATREPTVAIQDLESTRSLMNEECGGCHEVYDPTVYSDTEWESWVLSMGDFVDLTDAQIQGLVSYRGENHSDGSGSGATP